MGNLDIYNVVRTAPPEALKTITAGRLQGMTDINPMWRIKVLTELFGACGFGWKYEIKKQWLETGANGEVSAFCNIDLYVKDKEKWSEPIPGTGGSSFVANERKGAYTSDECYKKALTDAISVACKALGIAADVYWNQDTTKYQTTPKNEPELPLEQPPPVICPSCNRVVKSQKKQVGTDVVTVSPEDVLKGCGGICFNCYKAKKGENQP